MSYHDKVVAVLSVLLLIASVAFIFRQEWDLLITLWAGVIIGGIILNEMNAEILGDYVSDYTKKKD